MRFRLIEISAVILIILTTLCVSATLYLNQGPFWVGERTTRKLFDYHRCPELVTDRGNVVIFASEEEARAQGYRLSADCR